MKWMSGPPIGSIALQPTEGLYGGLVASCLAPDRPVGHPGDLERDPEGARATCGHMSALGGYRGGSHCQRGTQGAKPGASKEAARPSHGARMSRSEMSATARVCRCEIRRMDGRFLGGSGLAGACAPRSGA